ncbi:MAG: peptidoglycan D,D-transpeptidase FtsI family protein [Candidatus Limnocylindria bacterium]
MIGAHLPRLGTAMLGGFALLLVAMSWWQVVTAASLEARPDNPALIAAHRSEPRGTIFDTQGTVLATTVVVDGIARRTYASPASTHLLGYASLRYGTSGIESAWDELLVGLRDPNPLHDLVNDVFQLPPQPHDLVLTVDARLQQFAAAQLAGSVGAVVAIDPTTGAVLAMTSSPTFDATAISGDPAQAEAPWNALLDDPGQPFVDRARNGVYVPGSVMKVLTAAAALEAGVITPSTTFPTQPQEEVTGLAVSGFTIREHDLAGVQPALWNLSQSMQISSNIYFAHVGLELGQARYLEAAADFGFCDEFRVGPPSNALRGAASSVTALTDTGCADFVDDAELASAAFGQARVSVTPLQMALLAAIVANDGVMMEPYVVREVRVPDPSGTPGAVTATYGSPGRRTVVSPTTAQQVRSVMVDAVHGPLGVPYAGAANVANYGIGGVQTAGKTGTAERGEGLPPHSWFIGFAAAQPGATPSIAVAVIVEGAGPGSASAAPIGGRVMAEWLRLIGS